MARPNWEWIKLDVLMPEHPKVEGLSDKAFRALVELWCYAGRQHTDGMVSAPRWRRLSLKVRAELITAGLADPLTADDEAAGVTMHDYTEHQRTKEEIDALSVKRSQSGSKAAAARWGSKGDTKSHTKPHDERNADASAAQCDLPCDSMPEAEAEAEADKDPPARGRAAPQGAARATRLPDDFQITSGMAAWASENVPEIDYLTETMRFRDYWKSAAGAKARKTDWEATWRNWMRRAADDIGTRQQRPPARPSHQPTHDEFAALRQNWARPLDAIEARNDPR